MHTEKEHLVGSKYTHNKYTQIYKPIYVDFYYSLCVLGCVLS